MQRRTRLESKLREMESKAATAWLLLLAVVAAAGAALPPASSAAKVASYNYNNAAVAAAAALSTAAWVEDAVEIFPAEARPEMMMLAGAAGGGGGGVDHELDVHRRVLAGGGYRNPSIVPDQVRCFRNHCQGRGGSYTGRGNQCYFQNQVCRL